MKVTNFLKDIKNTILTEDTWLQHVYACDKDNISVPAYSPWACKWCIQGAFFKYIGAEQWSEPICDAWNILHQVSIDLYGESPVGVNDQKGFESIHRCLDEAIKRAEAGGQ